MSYYKLVWSAALITAVLAAFAPGLATGAPGETRVSARNMTSDTVWSGTVVVEVPVTVVKGATLTIKPGSRVLFVKDAGLTVEGAFKAEGTSGQAVTFTSAEKEPSAGCWTGINFALPDDGVSSLLRARVEYAGSVTVSSGKVTVEGCELAKGVKGLVAVSRSSAPVFKNNRISDMQEGGVQCSMGSAPLIAGNVIERCGHFGISSSQESMSTIRGNTVSGCEAGMLISQFVLVLEGNTVKDNGGGIVLSLASGELTVKANKVSGNEAGIVCQQFSSPAIVNNEVTKNKQGLVCFRSSSPLVTNNSFTGNDEAIACIQICNPVIRANSIHDNKKGIYLDLSSYAEINGNNIYDNELQVELGNMSSDWEQRVRNKPPRGSQAKNLSQAQRGRAVAHRIEDDANIMGYVDATGNWWGGPTTAEMDKKGADADIERFVDYYDVPVRTYEGYEGEYVQDRIKYEGWLKSKIKDAGIKAAP